MLLEVRLRALAPRADRHGVVLVRVARRRELVQVRAVRVLADDEEAYTVRTPSVFLRVYLGFCAIGLCIVRFIFDTNERQDLLSAMAETSLCTGIARLKTMRSPIACWRMKLLVNSI